jgi:DNA-binding IclR family transcriptional regulator
MLSTIRKSGWVLELFDVQHPERGVSEVATSLRIPKSSAHELLSTMADVGLLRRTATGRYRLGWKILGLSHVLVSSTELLAEARPVMTELVRRYGENVHLAVLDGDLVTYVEKVQGTRAIQIAVTWVGSRLPAHCSAVGKVLLASRPWTEVEEILERQGMRPLTPRTTRTPARLRAELEEVTAVGFAYDLEEAVPDLCCVAAPIYDYTQQVIAAISLSVPAYRFHRSRDVYREAIVAAARAISRNMGYRPGTARGPVARPWVSPAPGRLAAGS